MGRAKPHVGGGPRPMYLWYNTFANRHEHIKFFPFQVSVRQTKINPVSNSFYFQINKVFKENQMINKLYESKRYNIVRNSKQYMTTISLALVVINIRHNSVSVGRSAASLCPHNTARSYNSRILCSYQQSVLPSAVH
jgi:hypothetical protein